MMRPALIYKQLAALAIHCLLTTIILLCLAATAQAAPAYRAAPKSILLIHSYNIPLSQSCELSSSFLAGMNSYGDPYVLEQLELDASQLPGEAIQRKFSPYIERIIDGKYDAIVAINDPALKLLRDNFDKLPSAIPVVFFGVGEFDPYEFKDHPQTTGNVDLPNSIETLQLGLRLFPNLRHVVLLTNPGIRGDAFATKVQKYIRKISTVDIRTFRSNSPSDRVVDAVHELGSKTMVLFQAWDQGGDFAGSGQQMLSELSSKTDAPVFVLRDSLLQFGVIGGVVSRGRESGRDAAAKLHAIFEGRNASEIQVTTMSPLVMLSFFAVERFAISDENIPPGAVFIGKPNSFWVRHQNIIIWSGTGLIVILLIVTAASLIFGIKKRNELRDMTIFQRLPIRFFILDLKGNILSHTEHGGRVFPGNKPPLRKLSDIRGINREEISTLVRKAISQQHDVTVNYTFFGEYRSAFISPLPFDLYKRHTVLWVSQNMSELQLSQRKASDSARRFLLTLQSIGDGVIVTDAEEKITVMNDIALQLTGYQGTDYIGKKVSEVMELASSATGSKVESSLHRTLVTGKKVTQSGAIDLIAQGGKRYRISASAAPVRDEGGELTGAVLVFRDITQECETTELLASQNLRLKTASAIADIVYFDFDSSGIEHTADRLPERFWGRDSKDRMLPPEKWISLNDLTGFLDSVRKLTKGDVSHMETAYRVGTGENLRYYEFCANSLGKNQNGEERFSAVIRDTTNLRRNEQQRDDARLLFDSLINHMPGYFFAKNADDDFRYVVCNKEHEHFWARRLDQIIGKTDMELCSDSKFAEILRKEDEELCDGGEPVVATRTYTDQAGNQIISKVFKRLVRLSDGTRLILGMRLDISDIENARRAERETRRLFEVLLDNLPIAVAIQDARDNFRYQICNRVFSERMAGTGIGNVIGKNDFELMSKEEAIDIHETETRIMASGQPIQRRIILRDHTYIVNAAPVTGAEGEIVNIVKCAIDVTDIETSRRDRETALRAARAADTAKSFFLATMSHEIRTPLNAVIGFAELLQLSEHPRDEQLEYLKSISSGGNALLNLVNDMLELTKIEADQTEITPEKVDLRELCSKTGDIFRQQAADKRLGFDIMVPKSLPEVWVDKLRLRQILINIISNAVKFTNRGGVTIKVKFTPTTASLGELDIDVADTGIGIPEKFKDLIFQPFSQPDRESGQGVASGAGLGLTISQRLAKKMNGKITFTSKENEGSVFTIAIERVRFESNAKLATLKTSAADQCRVLLVDDLPLNLKVLSTMIKRLHFISDTAGSAKDALYKLRASNYGFVLTDMWMPGMNGCELAEKIREDHAYDKIKIIAVTADSDAGKNFDMKNFDGVLLKPVTLERLEILFSSLATASETGKKPSL